jgi:hypothetical protein
VLTRKLYLISREPLHAAAVGVLVVAALGATSAGQPPSSRLEILQSVAALPPHLVGQFGEPAGFQQESEGDYFVVDRRGHTVSRIDRAMTAITPLLAIGHEAGRVLRPFGFDLGVGEFAVADAPGATERVQVFTTGGSRVSAFTLSSRSEARVQLDGLVLNGASAMRLTSERTILLNQPDTGALVSEYDIRGRALRSVGTPRATGHDGDAQLRLAFNAGLPVPIPGGGLYFVFQTGEPRFRKYNAAGTLVFERAIQGRELDALVQTQPTTWPRRPGVAVRDIPVVRPLVRAATVDQRGQLWISFTVPFTYVYDPDGEKTRVVQFRGAGLLMPTSLFFARDGTLLVTPGCYVFRP